MEFLTRFKRSCAHPMMYKILVNCYGSELDKLEQDARAEVKANGAVPPRFCDSYVLESKTLKQYLEQIEDDDVYDDPAWETRQSRGPPTAAQLKPPHVQ